MKRGVSQEKLAEMGTFIATTLGCSNAENIVLPDNLAVDGIEERDSIAPEIELAVGDSACAVEEYETTNGPADYALCVDGRILGIVEAKKLTLGPQSVLTCSANHVMKMERCPIQPISA